MNLEKENSWVDEKTKFSYEPNKYLTYICSTCTRKIGIEETRCFVSRDYVKEATILAFCFAQEGKLPKYVETLWPGVQVCETCFGFIGKLESHSFLLDKQVEKSLLLGLLTLPIESLNTIRRVKDQIKTLPHLAKIYAHLAEQTLKEEASELNSATSTLTISSSMSTEKIHEIEAPSTSYGSFHLAKSSKLQPPFMDEKFVRNEKEMKTFDKVGQEMRDERTRKFLKPFPFSFSFPSFSFSFPSFLSHSQTATSYPQDPIEQKKYFSYSPVSDAHERRSQSPYRRSPPYFDSLEELTEVTEENAEFPLNITQTNDVLPQTTQSNPEFSIDTHPTHSTQTESSPLPPIPESEAETAEEILATLP